MDDPQGAIADLRSAISGVRAACRQDARCKDLLQLLDRTEEAIKEVSYTPDHGDEKPDEKLSEEDRPRNLRDAASETRRRFQQDRQTRDPRARVEIF